jgi:tetraacyldisaccharide 4'-kinase
MTKLQPFGNSLVPRILSILYGVIIFFRNLYFDYHPHAIKKTAILTISVGSIHAGGTGKTPMTLLLGQFFQNKGYSVGFLSRGYARHSRQAVLVKPHEKIPWQEIGDEPALLKQNLPASWLGIGANRIANARNLSACMPGASVFILDDAFQHRKIFRDVNVVCLPSNPCDDYLLPAGFLREPLSALRRADIIGLIGTYKEKEILEKNKKQLSTFCNPCIIFILYQSAEGWVHLKSGKVFPLLPCSNPVLISGIARPHRLGDMVSDLGVTPYKRIYYEDHHIISSKEIQSVCTSSVDGVILTEKDVIKLSEVNLENCPDIWYLKIRLRFFEKEAENKFFLTFSCRKQ